MANSASPEAITMDVLEGLNGLRANYVKARDHLTLRWLGKVVEAGGRTSLRGFIALMHAVDCQYPQTEGEKHRVDRYFTIDREFRQFHRAIPVAYIPRSESGFSLVESFGVLDPRKEPTLTYTIKESTPAAFEGTVALRLRNVHTWNDGETPVQAGEQFFTLVTATRGEGTSTAEDFSADYMLGMEKIWEWLNPAEKTLQDTLTCVKRLAHFMANTELAA